MYVTSSIGVASSQDGNNIEKLFSNADKAKSQGKKKQ